MRLCHRLIISFKSPGRIIFYAIFTQLMSTIALICYMNAFTGSGGGSDYNDESSNYINNDRNPRSVNTAKDKESTSNSTQIPFDFARDAFNRAQTPECKEAIFETERQQKAGTLYYSGLFMGSCPSSNITKAEYLGCFVENATDPNLNSVTKSFKDNTPSRCIEYCFTVGLPYAGLYRGTVCRCGTAFGKYGTFPKMKCKLRCPGDTSRGCGGLLAVSVYSTEVGRPDFVQPVIPAANLTDHEIVQNQARIAFLLSLNGRAMRQVGRLLRVIYRPEHFYFIHVDKRLNYLHAELTTLTRGLSNIYVANEDLRFSSIWGGASLLTMLLSSFKYLVDRNDWKWDFVINLSETDFPVRTVDELASFLGVNKNLNFIATHVANTERYLANQGAKFTFLECENHMWHLNERPFPRGIRMFGASDWVTLNREFVEFIIHGERQADPLLIGLRRFFKYSLLPAESYFHTVLLNTKFCNRVVNDNLRLVNWQRDRGCSCQKSAVDWCGCSPNNLLTGDFQELKRYANLNSQVSFFARKFEEVVDQQIVNLIEVNLLRTLSDKTTAMDYFWYCEFSSQSDGPHHQHQSFYVIFSSWAINVLSPLPSSVGGEVCPPFESPPEIQSAHSLLVRNVFQGTLVKFGVGMYVFEAIFGKSQDNLAEAKKVEKSLDANLNKQLEVLFSLWHYRVSSVSVGSEYDTKETIFRNFGSFIVTRQRDVCLRVAWQKLARAPEKMLSKTLGTVKNATDEGGVPIKLLVVITSPNASEIHCKVNVKTSVTIDSVTTYPDYGVACLCQNSFHLTEPGVWTVKLLSASDNLPSVSIGLPVRFPVFPDNGNMPPSKAMLSFWSLLDICLVASESSANPNCFPPSSSYFLQSCTERPWSSVSGDVKSAPNFKN